MSFSSAPRRAGGILIYSLFATAALTALLVLAVDYGRATMVKTEAMRAADAAARHAAKGVLDGTYRAKAEFVASQNSVDNRAITLLNSDVVTGNWNTSASPQFSTSRSPTNAVQVTVGMTAARGTAIPTAFAGGFGHPTVDVTATAIALYTPPAGFGLVGLDWVDINSNAITNSYTSGTSAYSAATAGSAGYPASNGGVKINSSTISKDVYMRAGQTLDASSSSYGTRQTLASPLSIPTPSAGSYSTFNDNSSITPAGARSGGNFDADGMTVTIPGGNYYFTNFTANSSTLNVTGPATIYVNGNVSLNSLAVNVAGNLPSNLTIKVVKASGASVMINSVLNLWADIQAPTASIEVNSVNQHFYGRMIGKTLKLNSVAQVHVDQSLPAIDGATLPPTSAVSGRVALVE